MLYLQNDHAQFGPLALRVFGTCRYAPTFNILMMQATTGGAATFASATWPTNDLAIYYPITMPGRFKVARFMVANGANATGNVDVGLYSEAGVRLLSTGTTLRAGTNAMQYIGVTDSTFPPGNYYLALVASSTTGSYMRSASQGLEVSKISGFLQEALGSTVLPTTMTPASYTTSANIYHFGFSQSDTL